VDDLDEDNTQVEKINLDKNGQQTPHSSNQHGYRGKQQSQYSEEDNAGIDQLMMQTERDCFN
jgi:hypothetical protein